MRKTSASYARIGAVNLTSSRKGMSTAKNALDGTLKKGIILLSNSMKQMQASVKGSSRPVEAVTTTTHAQQDDVLQSIPEDLVATDMLPAPYTADGVAIIQGVSWYTSKSR